LELIDRISGPVKNIDTNVQQVKAHTSQMNDVLTKTSAINLLALAGGIRDLGNQFQSAIAPGIAFQDGLAEVEAITGVTGAALDALGAKARSSSKDFGGSAADSLNSYKVILSRLGPDIAKNQEALDGMERNVRTLSKTMGGDATKSVDALTTAMLQYRVDLSDPAKATEEMTAMMNTMAAGAKFGSAEVDAISLALKVSGVQAKLSKLTFEETNAALQELARGGKEGAEAGTALRNVLGKMAGEDIVPKEAADKLRSLGVNMNVVSDTSRPFSDRLRELAKAQGDATVMAQVFGVENAAAANILLNSIDAQEELTEKITGTNTAFEQADVIMGTYSEKMSRLKTRLEDFGIGMFNVTKSFAPLITGAAATMDIYLKLKAVFGEMNFTVAKNTLANAWNAVSSFSAAKAATNLRNKLLGVSGGAMAAGTSMGFMGAMSDIATFGMLALGVGIRAVSKAIYSIPIVGWILAIISAIIALFAYLWNNVDGFQAFFYGLWAVIKDVFGGLVTTVSSVFGWLWDTVTGIFTGIKDWAVNAWNAMVNGIATALGSVYDKVKTVFTSVKDAIAGAFRSAYALISPIIERIKEIIGKVQEKIQPLIDGAKRLMGIFQKGRDKRLGELAKEKEGKKGEKGGAGIDAMLADGTSATSPTAPADPTAPSGGGSGGTGGGGKTITMTLNIQNHFNVSGGTDVESIADKIVGKINDRLRDGMVALG
jgi:TP901 family phage tail tape measure protein